MYPVVDFDRILHLDTLHPTPPLPWDVSVQGYGEFSYRTN